VIIVDLSRKGFPAALRRWRAKRQTNPYTSRKEMQAALSQYMGESKATGSNKKTSGSATHVTGSNLKLAKSSMNRNVAYLTTGLAFTSATFLWQAFAGPRAAEIQRKNHISPATFGLTPADIEALKGDKRGVCPSATKGCMATCLVDAGQQGTPAAKNAQIRRQLAFKFRRDALMATVAIEIANLIKRVQLLRKRGSDAQIFPAIRLNVNSDIDWENVAFEVDPWLAEIVRKASGGSAGVRPGVQSIITLFGHSEAIFYDYTKRPDRFMRYATDPAWPSNYFLTFSLSENPLHRRTAMEYLRMVQSGEPVRPAQIAVPFAFYDRAGKRYVRLPGKKGWQWPLPKELTIVDEATGASITAPVLDADPSDARFDDAHAHPGSIAGLRFKEILSKSTGGTIATYSAKHVDPAVKLGFILKAPEGVPEVVIGVRSGGRQLSRAGAA
jgi:hypothetical protein